MPRNDQVTRQWHLLQRLGAARQGLTLAQLVEAIPEDLTRHPRTVRRDLLGGTAIFPSKLARLDNEGLPFTTSIERKSSRAWRLTHG